MIRRRHVPRLGARKIRAMPPSRKPTFSGDYRWVAVLGIVLAAVTAAAGRGVDEILQAGILGTAIGGAWEWFGAKHPVLATRLFGAVAPHPVKMPSSSRGWLHRHERLYLSACAFATTVGPIYLALVSVNGPEADREDVYAAFARLWLAGLAVGVALQLISAARGELILRTPAKVARGLIGNQRLALAVTPIVMVFAILVVAWAPLPHVDPRIPFLLVLGGFLVAVWPVALYVTFRFRPGEMFSEDPAIARAAAERFWRHPQEGHDEP
jgi:hypothetical protein